MNVISKLETHWRHITDCLPKPFNNIHNVRGNFYGEIFGNVQSFAFPKAAETSSHYFLGCYWSGHKRKQWFCKGTIIQKV